MLRKLGGAGLGAARASMLLGAVGAVVAGGALWRAVLRDLEWLRQTDLGFGGRAPSRRPDDHPRRASAPEACRQLASEQAPAPASDDALSPGNVIRENAENSRTERLGDGTPTGPIASPPVDPRRT